MRSSLRLGRIAGVDVGLHWSVALIAFLLTTTLANSILPAQADGFAQASYLLAALATTGLFLGSIVAHELGHSIVAERNGIKVKGITLFALGGVAALDDEPETPGVAARVALAGPAVSVAVGAASLVAAVAAGAVGLSTLTVAGLAWLGLINLFLAVFNMVPALPMDGGRVLHSVMWKLGGDRNRATVRAATIGRYLGWAVILFGIWQLSVSGAGLWTVLIGFFITSSARAEEIRARIEQQQAEGPPPPPRGGWFGPGPEGPAGFGPQPPRPSDRPDVIDVDGRLVDDDGPGAGPDARPEHETEHEDTVDSRA